MCEQYIQVKSFSLQSPLWLSGKREVVWKLNYQDYSKAKNYILQIQILILKGEC